MKVVLPEPEAPTVIMENLIPRLVSFLRRSNEEEVKFIVEGVSGLVDQ